MNDKRLQEIERENNHDQIVVRRAIIAAMKGQK